MKLESAGDFSQAVAPDPAAIASASHGRDFGQINAVLLLGFAPPFLLGTVRELMFRSLVMPGVGFAIAWLATTIVISAATVYFVIQRDRMPLSSIGINQPVERDLLLAIALFACVLIAPTLLRLVGVTPHGTDALHQLMWAEQLGAYRIFRMIPLGLGLSIAIAAAVAQELVARGYAIRALRASTGSLIVAAVLALALDLVCYSELVGRQPLVIWSASIIFTVGYLLGQTRLLPFVLARAMLNLTVIATLLWSPPRVDPALTLRQANDIWVESVRHIANPTADLPSHQISAPPGSAAFYSNRAAEEKDLLRNDLELTDLESALKLEPKNRDYLERHAEAEFSAGNLDTAMTEFNQLVASDPADPRPYRGRATVYAARNDFKSSLEEIDRAMKLAPADPLNYERRANIYVTMNELDQAMVEVDAALRLAPRDPGSLNTKAQINDRQGDYAHALEDCDLLISTNPADSRNYDLRTTVRIDMNDNQGALQDISTAISLAPKDARLYMSRGLIELSLGKLTAARDDIRTAARLGFYQTPEWSNDGAWMLATSDSAESRDGAAAIVLATRACDATEWKSWSYIDTLAAAYAEAGDFRKAVKWQQRAIELSGSEVSSRVQHDLRRRLWLYRNDEPYRESFVDSKYGNTLRTVFALMTLTLIIVGVVVTIRLFRRKSASV